MATAVSINHLVCHWDGIMNLSLCFMNSLTGRRPWHVSLWAFMQWFSTCLKYASYSKIHGMPHLTMVSCISSSDAYIMLDELFLFGLFKRPSTCSMMIMHFCMSIGIRIHMILLHAFVIVFHITLMDSTMTSSHIKNQLVQQPMSIQTILPLHSHFAEKKNI